MMKKRQKILGKKRWSFSKNTMSKSIERIRYGQPKVIVTDRLRSYSAAMNVIGNGADQECGRWRNNRTGNSHQPFRRREGAMSEFWDVKTRQKFASVHASIHNHFNLDRHLNRRETF